MHALHIACKAIWNPLVLLASLPSCPCFQETLNRPREVVSSLFCPDPGSLAFQQEREFFQSLESANNNEWMGCVRIQVDCKT